VPALYDDDSFRWAANEFGVRRARATEKQREFLGWLTVQRGNSMSMVEPAAATRESSRHRSRLISPPKISKIVRPG
jgi:hypothetical protein